ncbi:oxidoreductase [Kaistia sp. 32K]|uniref:aldo/keto reductase n=1 Tax=Kaistia sp. 32K TaxID=2795690 RepID=UPI001915A1D3|nr:aldo/keto reductase [Kaistia sp. 32K]BCP55183.1 oxidoreductase [Kaistia sp. 32K]
MKRAALGRTGLSVSALSFGASALGGVFRDVDETEAIATVHAALDAGINYFDVAPAYGGGRSETVLGQALKGIDRSRYVLSTKIGKYTDPNQYGRDTLDYSAGRITRSLEESTERLGTDYFDILHIHDIEYQDRQHTEWALGEGLETLLALKQAGRIGAVSFGIYPMDLWHRIFAEFPVDAALVHNHYCLNDTRLLELLPLARERGIGVINASPFASGLLTERGPADWHAASTADRALFGRAADYCAARGVSISELAFQFSTGNPDIPTTMFSTASRASLQRCLDWYGTAPDPELVAAVQAILAPVMGKDWG